MSQGAKQLVVVCGGCLEADGEVNITFGLADVADEMHVLLILSFPLLATVHRGHIADSSQNGRVLLVDPVHFLDACGSV